MLVTFVLHPVLYLRQLTAFNHNTNMNVDIFLLDLHPVLLAI